MGVWITTKYHQPSPLHLWQLKSQHHRNHRQLHHPPSPPPWWLLPRGVMPSPLLPQGPSPSPTMGFLFSFIVDHYSWSLVLPLTTYFICTLLRFCTVGIPFPSLTAGAELSKPIAKYLSVLITWSCRGMLRIVTSLPRLRFAFGKASAAVTLVGRLKCLNWSFLHPLPGFRPVAQLQPHYTLLASTSLPLPILAGTLLPYPPLASTLRPPPPSGRPSVTIPKHASVTPVLSAVAKAVRHSPQGPLFDVLCFLSSYPAPGHCFAPQHHFIEQVYTFLS